MLAAGGFIFILLLASISIAAPTSIVPLTPSEVSSYKPFTHFASATHCSKKAIDNWSCGGTSFLLVLKLGGPSIWHLYIALTTADCKANSDFIPVASGGNGDSVQLCKRCSLNFGKFKWWNYTTIYVEGYVGFSPSQSTVIVAHEGTDISKMLVQFLHSFNKSLNTMCIAKPMLQMLAFFWNR